MEFEAVFITSVPAWLSFKVCGGLLTMPESIPGVPVDHYGLLSLLPTVLVIATAVLTHRPVAALLTGVVIGILLLGTHREVCSALRVVGAVRPDGSNRGADLIERRVHDLALTQPATAVRAKLGEA